MLLDKVMHNWELCPTKLSISVEKFKTDDDDDVNIILPTRKKKTVKQTETYIL